METARHRASDIEDIHGNLTGFCCCYGSSHDLSQGPEFCNNSHCFLLCSSLTCHCFPASQSWVNKSNPFILGGEWTSLPCQVWISVLLCLLFPAPRALFTSGLVTIQILKPGRISKGLDNSLSDTEVDLPSQKPSPHDTEVGVAWVRLCCPESPNLWGSVGPITQFQSCERFLTYMNLV